MKVDVELEPFTPLLRPTYADAHAGAISEVRMEGYEFGHTCVCKGPGGRTRRMVLKRCSSERGEREKRFYRDGKCERRRTVTAF